MLVSISAFPAGDNPDVTFTFDVAADRVDGSALLASDIETQRIYIYKDGLTEPYAVLDAPESPVVQEITVPGMYTAQITTIEVGGRESAKSTPITFLVTLPKIGVPNPPGGFGGGASWACSVNCNLDILMPN